MKENRESSCSLVQLILCTAAPLSTLDEVASVFPSCLIFPSLQICNLEHGEEPGSMQRPSK